MDPTHPGQEGTDLLGRCQARVPPRGGSRGWRLRNAKTGPARLTGRALPLVVISAVAGLVSIALLIARWYVLARGTAALAVAAVLWGWALAQYPVMLPPHVTVADAAARPTVLHATLVSAIIGIVLLARRYCGCSPALHN